jgi:hypothetical protein
LLRQTVGKLRGRLNACLECGTALPRERTVGERRERRDLLANAFFVSTAPQHRNRNGNREFRESMLTSWRTPFGRTYSRPCRE